MVEGVARAKKPPARRASARRAAAAPAGRDHRHGAVHRHLERAAGVHDLRQADPGRPPDRGRRARSRDVPAVRGGDLTMADDDSRPHARGCKAALPQRGRSRPPGASSGYGNPMQVPRLEKIVVNMGVGDAIQRREAAGRRRRGPGDHHRPEAGDHQGPEVDRRVQAPRGHVDRGQGDAAGRPDVGVPRPAARRRRCRGSGTSAGLNPDAFDGSGNYTIGRDRAADLPRDRLRQGGQGPGHGHHDRDHRARRRRGPRAAAGAGVPVRGRPAVSAAAS